MVLGVVFQWFEVVVTESFARDDEEIGFVVFAVCFPVLMIFCVEGMRTRVMVVVREKM